jgi:hypothetical protein
MTEGSEMGVIVTQADREAAASAYFAWISGGPIVPRKMLDGLLDDHSMVQAFRQLDPRAVVEGDGQ